MGAVVSRQSTWGFNSEFRFQITKTFTMLMPKRNRKLIFENLFKEGVLVCKKDPYAPKHAEIDVPNLHVMKACQSLVSKGYLKEKFSWGYHYFTLTNEGIQFLREYLHLPTEIVPATLKRQQKATDKARPRVNAARPAYQNQDRDAYRGGDKKADVGAGAGNFEFRGGFGRGRGAPQQ